MASRKSNPAVLVLGSAGFIVGGLLGFLIRPSMLLLGQLPLDIVITRGIFLTGRGPYHDSCG